MRPAGMIAKLAKAHQDCDITLKTNGKTIKASSTMQIMSACIKKGNTVEILCNGANEKEVLDEITALFENGFGE